MQEGDLTVRNGLIVDGTGAAPFLGDVEIRAGRIASVRATDGRAIDGGVTDGGAAAGAEEIDAKGKLVTPGFVDIHTHYDGQAVWSDRLSPSLVARRHHRGRRQLRRRLRALPAGAPRRCWSASWRASRTSPRW